MSNDTTDKDGQRQLWRNGQMDIASTNCPNFILV